MRASTRKYLFGVPILVGIIAFGVAGIFKIKIDTKVKEELESLGRSPLPSTIPSLSTKSTFGQIQLLYEAKQAWDAAPIRIELIDRRNPPASYPRLEMVRDMDRLKPALAILEQIRAVDSVGWDSRVLSENEASVANSIVERLNGYSRKLKVTGYDYEALKIARLSLTIAASLRSYGTRGFCLSAIQTSLSTFQFATLLENHKFSMADLSNARDLLGDIARVHASFPVLLRTECELYRRALLTGQSRDFIVSPRTITLWSSGVAQLSSSNAAVTLFERLVSIEQQPYHVWMKGLDAVNYDGLWGEAIDLKQRIAGCFFREVNRIDSILLCDTAKDC